MRPPVALCPNSPVAQPPRGASSARRILKTVLMGTAAITTVVLVYAGGQVSTAAATMPTGAGMALNAPIVSAAATPDGRGYWESGSDGGIFTFGDAPFYGSTGSLRLNRPIVDIVATQDGRGYWEVAGDGGVFAFGDARFHGSTGSLVLVRPIVGIDPTPDDGGYWMVASDGGIFAFGDAAFYGSASTLSPDSPIVGMASTPDGHGYWEAAADGAVYAFGDARFAGVAPAGAPVVGINAAGRGYRLATSDGAVYALGGAAFMGSTAGEGLNRPVIGLSSARHGYLTVASDGGVFTFGGVGYYGSLAGSRVTSAAGDPGLTTSDGVTNYQRAAWERVNLCEEGGVWNRDGAMYSGGLGFSHANWDAFNTFGYPSDAADATPEEQIRVAVAFATRYWGNPNAAPDQNGCDGGY